MAMRANILLEQGDVAAEELLALVAHSQAPTGLCLNAMQVGIYEHLYCILSIMTPLKHVRSFSIVNNVRDPRNVHHALS